MTRLTVVSSRLAVLAACSVCALPSISQAAGGTISFVGAIVEPAYEVRMTAGAPSSAHVTSISRAETEVNFSSSDKLRATVRADGLGSSTVAVRCIGSSPIVAGGCHLGPRGGAFSVAAVSPAVTSEVRGAMLTVAYD